MVATSASARWFDSGRAIRRTFDLIGHNWPTFAALSFLWVMIPQEVWAVWLRLSGHVYPGGMAAFQSVWYWLRTLLVVMTDSGLQAALVVGAMTILRGQRASVSDCLVAGLRLLPAVFAIRISALVAAYLGFLLLIVPGVMIALAWAVVVPVEVVEQTGVIRAFGRSADLTRGRRRALFAITAAYYLLAVIFAVVVVMLHRLANSALMMSAHASWIPWLNTLIAPFENSILELFFSVGLASVYYELRTLKEGIGPDQLASAFD